MIKIPYTKEKLGDLFRYNPVNGELYWKIDIGNMVKKGDRVGYLRQGYMYCKIGNFGYRVDCIIFKMLVGDDYEKYIDYELKHLDGDKLNNRIDNLKPVKPKIYLKKQDKKSENQKTKTKRKPATKVIQKNNKSGHVGVTFHKRFDKWQVWLRKDGVNHFGGYHDNLEDAIEARKKLEQKVSQKTSIKRLEISKDGDSIRLTSKKQTFTVRIADENSNKTIDQLSKDDAKQMIEWLKNFLKE